jgi:glycerol-3-phosphate acyltransferase PlsY
LVSSWPWGILLFRSRTQGSGLGDFGSTKMFRVLGLPCVCMVIWLVDAFRGHWRLLLTQKPVYAGFTNFGSSLFHFKSC